MKNLLIVFFCLQFFIAKAQWSAPVNISQGLGYSKSAFTIDSLGIIHCIWAEYFPATSQTAYRYSKSSDDGNTWLPSKIIVKMNGNLINNHIVSDSAGSLWIAYTNVIEGTPNIVRSYIKHFDGVAWGDSILVASGLNFTYLRDIFIDSKNRLFVIYRLDKDYISYYSNGQWSQPISCPYQQGNAYVDLWYGAIDKNNILHFGGAYSINYLPEQSYSAYYRYNTEECHWAPPILIANAGGVTAMCPGVDNNIHFAYVISRSDTSNYIEEYYSKYQGSLPVNNILFYTHSYLSENPKICVDERGGVHIANYQINWDAKNTGTLSYYYKNAEDNQFIKEHVFVNDNIWENKLIYYKNKLYLLCGKSPDANIYLCKRAISTFIDDDITNCGSAVFQIYPNPFTESVTISFLLEREELVNIKIYNMQGICINEIVSQALPAGNYSYHWNGKLQNEIPALAGVYFCSFTTSQKQIQKILIKQNHN